MQETVQLKSVLVKSLRPPKFRLRTEMADLEELKQSIKDVGLLEPIIVKEANGKYEIVCGHRRWMALVEAGIAETDVKIVNVDDKTAFEISLTENLQRHDLDSIEEARAFNAYLNEFGYGGVNDLSKKIKRSPQYVSQRLSLLNLPDTIKTEIKTHSISPSTAEQISRLDAAKAIEMADIVKSVGLSEANTGTAVGYVKAGLDVNEAVRRTLEYPDAAPPKPGEKFDPIKLAKEGVVLDITKCLKNVDDDILQLPEGEERARYIHLVRSPLHDLSNVAIRLKMGKEK